MKKERPKPAFCEKCNLVVPKHLACVGEYKPDPENFRWMCVSCHYKYDIENGTHSPPPSRRGKKHTVEARRKMSEVSC